MVVHAMDYIPIQTKNTLSHCLYYSGVMSNKEIVNAHYCKRSVESWCLPLCRSSMVRTLVAKPWYSWYLRSVSYVTYVTLPEFHSH